MAQLASWLTSACSLYMCPDEADEYTLALVSHGFDRVSLLAELREDDWPAVVHGFGLWKKVVHVDWPAVGKRIVQRAREQLGEGHRRRRRHSRRHGGAE